MQFDSMPEVFASATFTREHPLSPEGVLFTYYPLEEPEALHYHDFLEIGYCEWGTGLFYIDGEYVPFNGPCCSIIYGGQIHIAQSIGPEKSLWHFLYVDLDKLFAGAEAVALGETRALKPHLYDFPALIARDDDPVLYHLCAAVMREAAELREQYLTAVRALMTAALVRHSRYMTPARKLRRAGAQLLDRLGAVLGYINHNYMNDITMDELTDAGRTSKSTLRRDMIAFTGMAPLQYVHHLRIKRAAAMLLGRDSSIAQVSLDVGYGSLSSFNRQFHSAFGMSPSQWRKTRTTHVINAKL